MINSIVTRGLATGSLVTDGMGFGRIFEVPAPPAVHRPQNVSAAPGTWIPRSEDIRPVRTFEGTGSISFEVQLTGSAVVPRVEEELLLMIGIL